MNPEHERRRRFESVAADVYEPLQHYLNRRAAPEDAAEVLNDTLLVLWRRLDDIPDDPVPWSIGVARRSLANNRRSETRRLRLVQSIAGRTRDTAGSDPQDDVERSDPALAAALHTLTDVEAEIVRLWAWDRLAPRDIAVVVGLTPNAVSVALNRAKHKLAKRLDSSTSRSKEIRQKTDGAGHFRSTGTNGRKETPDG